MGLQESHWYHASVSAARPGKAVVPQISDNVRLVLRDVVFVRCESFTALPQGPSASNRQSRHSKRMT